MVEPRSACGCTVLHSRPRQALLSCTRCVWYLADQAAQIWKKPFPDELLLSGILKQSVILGMLAALERA